MQHVEQEHLLEPHQTCPVCASAGAREREIALQESPEIWMLRCNNCRAVSAEAFPTESYLTQLYDPAHYKPNMAGSDLLSSRCASRLVATVGQKISGDIRIVDYGGSDGNIARLFRKQMLETGYQGTIDITVVDLFPRELDDDIRFLTVDEFAAETCRYDIILASAVLEHLSNLGEVLQLLLSKRASTAWLYARTPYDIPIAKLGAKNRLVWPRHLHDLGPEFWEQFHQSFGVKGEYLFSGPSIVQTTFKQSPMTTTLAQLLKLPAKIENGLFKKPNQHRTPWWRWTGGWEVVAELSQ